MENDTLINLGLSDEEAQIYLSLLARGQQSASDLAKSTKVKRTYIYNVSASLIKKGLISQIKKGKTTVFNPASPDKLLTLAQEKKQKAAQAEQTLEAILPGLKTKFEVIDAKPVVTYYEGIEGIKKVYMDTIKEGKEMWSLVETSEVDPAIYEWLTKKYVTDRVSAGIKVKAIVASGHKTKIYTGLDEKELRESKVISNEKFPFKNEVNIYGNKIAIVNYKKGSQILGIIIDNHILASTFRSWFSLTWESIS